MDATFSADVMTERGIMGGLEYRYFLKDDLRGEMSYTFIDDDGYADHNGIRSEEGFRWGLDVYHRQTLPGDVQALVDINLVSDDTYLEDFADNVNLRTSPIWSRGRRSSRSFMPSRCSWMHPGLKT